ncbi:M48 family metallopeptidase [Mesobacillus subterraneus]|uniref:M48 family metallopeptidase n=1 Tax=Mesobacillus subterraneus TaxID=285983 RepID=UPI00273D80DB|nr:M48 family metallopeptidase [Mesobacillus subterraneus]WLR54698.1 M48 family metallopeptidase [Mesobacillus subterraneus]
MTVQEFEKLVNKLEKQASANPKLYRFKVIMLTGLGFGYVALFLSLFLFLMTISIAMIADGNFTFGNVKVLLLTGTLSFFIIKALIVKMEMPEGYYLQREEAPRLFEIIDTLRLRLNAPPIDAIVLDSEFNASVAQISSYGMFGKKRNVLAIGIPLLSTLSQQQFTAVLAHELAHISNSDTALGARIYRLRMSWSCLLHSLEENEQFGTFIFKKFFQWFYPRFDAYTFAMARQEEYAADRSAALATSSPAMGEALTLISVAAPYYYRDFYSELFEECAKTNSVPQPYSNFTEKFQSLSEQKSAEYFNEQLAEESYMTDTHPCLRDRLAALAIEAEVPEKPKESALNYFLAFPGRVINDFNKMWVDYNQDSWKEEIENFNDSKQRYEELTNKQVANLEELLEKAYLTVEFNSLEAAIPLYEEIAEKHSEDPQTAGALLTLAEHYLESRDTAEKGIRLIHLAMSYDWELRLPALDLLCGYYYETEQSELFENTREELEKWEEIVEASNVECDFIQPKDHFITHDKDSRELLAGINQLAQYKEITTAYLVRKQLASIPERKQYVLGLDLSLPKSTDLDEAEEALYEKYINGLGEFEDTCVIILNDKKDLRKSMLSVENSLIYSVSDKEQAS